MTLTLGTLPTQRNSLTNMGGMFLRVTPPPPELQEQYEKEQEESHKFESVEMFLSNRCFERGEIIHEISKELAQVRLNYEDVCKRLQKYEPDFVPNEEKPYSISDRMV